MIGIYFSGTGNTRYAVTRFVNAIDNTSSCFSIEENTTLAIQENDLIVFGFPVYYSHAPKIVRDYLEANKNLFKGKKVFIIATRGLFNAYGVIYVTKQFQNYGALVVGSMQINMPDNIRDMRIMKLVFNYSKDNQLLKKADDKIDKTVKRFSLGKKVKSGQRMFNYIVGGFLRILPFYPKTNKYRKNPKINLEKCVGCGVCAKICPKNNLYIENKKATSNNNCTLCYRCFSKCPTQAITVFGKKVYCQYYLNDNNSR